MQCSALTTGGVRLGPIENLHPVTVGCTAGALDLLPIARGVPLHNARRWEWHHLGVHRVRDFVRRQEISQLCGDQIPTSFPPLDANGLSSSPLAAIASIEVVGSSEIAAADHDAVVQLAQQWRNTISAAADTHIATTLKAIGDGCMARRPTRSRRNPDATHWFLRDPATRSHLGSIRGLLPNPHEARSTKAQASCNAGRLLITPPQSHPATVSASATATT